jgi:hypothetical protein
MAGLDSHVSAEKGRLARAGRHSRGDKNRRRRQREGPLSSSSADPKTNPLPY